ncbi:hypothetical protein AVEN_33260-1, partial [Araneus ventricosus]
MNIAKMVNGLAK